MTYSLLLHIAGEDAILVEVDDLPEPSAQYVLGTNPRYRDGKEVRNILPEVNQVMFPMWRINFIEILPGKEDEEIYGFYRE